MKGAKKFLAQESNDFLKDWKKLGKLCVKCIELHNE